MLESACSSDDLPAFGGRTSAICAAPSRRTAIESRWVTRFCTRVCSSWDSTHLRMSAYGPFLYPGSSARIVLSSRTRSEPSLPTSRRLISCICGRCGIGIASPSSPTCGKARATSPWVRCASCPAASTDAVIGSGGLAVLRAADGSPAMHTPTLQDRAFESEQPLLALEAAGVAREFSVCTDDTVAGENDRQWVAVHHHPDGASGTRPRGARCKLAVGDDLAVRDTGELAHDATVEVGEQGKVERQVELVPLPLEVLLELAARGIDRLRRPQYPDAEVAREAIEFPLGLRVVGD